MVISLMSLVSTVNYRFKSKLEALYKDYQIYLIFETIKVRVLWRTYANYNQRLLK